MLMLVRFRHVFGGVVQLLDRVLMVVDRFFAFVVNMGMRVLMRMGALCPTTGNAWRCRSSALESQPTRWRSWNQMVVHNAIERRSHRRRSSCAIECERHGASRWCYTTNKEPVASAIPLTKHSLIAATNRLTESA